MAQLTDCDVLLHIRNSNTHTHIYREKNVKKLSGEVNSVREQVEFVPHMAEQE